ncbi:MAG TPA: PHP domain-containing protein [Gemmatimonadaceae bacterium]
MTAGAGARPQEPARRIDLHLHTTASDGVLSPSALVEAARAAAVDIIALTDHDSIEGIVEARSAAGAPGASGVRVIAGVELSAHDDEREIHMLGLHLERLDGMRARLTELADARRERAREMVHRLNETGVRIEFDDVIALAGNSALGRPHVARTLIAHGWAHDHRDAFDRYLLPGRPGFVPKRRLPVTEAIAIVHEAGGLAVLAHPATEDSLERLTTFARQGLDGLEVAHPSLAADDRARLHAAADHLGLVKSGGSDWHGLKDGSKRIGAEDIPAAWLDAQQERVAARRSPARVA